jgi:uncharacterized membrane protein
MYGRPDAVLEELAGVAAAGMTIDNTARLWRGVGLLARIMVGLALLATPLLSHVALSSGAFVGGRFVALAAGIAACQAAVVIALLLRRWLPLWAWLAGTALPFAALIALGPRPFLWDEAQAAHTLLYVGLLLLFAGSLRPGRVDLITQLAVRMGGPQTPARAAYSRAVTKAWCGFFAAQLVVSAVLRWGAPPALWLTFNLLDLPLVCLMFVVEYAIRRWRFPGQRHASLVDSVRAFRARSTPAPDQGGQPP